MTRTWAATFSMVVAVTLGIFVSTGRAVGQPALTEMNAQVLSHLQADFNQESSKTRVILLLSPT